MELIYYTDIEEILKFLFNNEIPYEISYGGNNTYFIYGKEIEKRKRYKTFKEYRWNLQIYETLYVFNSKHYGYHDFLSTEQVKQFILKEEKKYA